MIFSMYFVLWTG